MRALDITTTRRVEFIDITQKVKRIIQEEEVNSGICIVFCPHTTAALTINENADPSVRKDIINHLDALVPESEPYSHLEGNADSHIKSSLVGHSLNIIIEGGELVLGTWQGIYFCELDGPRRRKIYIKSVKGN